MHEVPGYLTALVAVLVLASAGPASAEARPVEVFLDRGGQVIEVDGEAVAIPRFGGSDHAWTRLVGCVQDQFAPFQVDVVDRRPTHAGFITALVGGSPALVGYDATVAGVGPYDGTVLRGALVHVFTPSSSDELDVDELCAVAAHEVGHALGLDHATTCGDLMSYHHDACGPQRFVDVDAPCGTADARACGNGDATQNTYRRLGQLVGFRDVGAGEDEPTWVDGAATAVPADPYTDAPPDGDMDAISEVDIDIAVDEYADSDADTEANDDATTDGDADQVPASPWDHVDVDLPSVPASSPPHHCGHRGYARHR